MTNPIRTTVSDVVADRHPEDTIVILTGQANCFSWKTTKQGNTWATFLLLGLTRYTSVQARLLPAAYRQFGDGMGPTLADYRPQQLTITGRVINGWRQSQPEVIVTSVERHTEEPCESLEKMRRMDLRVRERFAESFPDGPPEPRPPGPDEGVGIREVIARLRGESKTEHPS